VITVVVGLTIGSRRSSHERSAGVDKLIPPQ
jgi:hypothetical protein